MAYTMPIDANGCITVKATAAITTPFVFLKWDINYADQVVVATDEKDPCAGILMHAVAAGDGCQVFVQRGGVCPIAMSESVVKRCGINPTTGGYGASEVADAAIIWAVSLEAAGDEYDIINCQFLGAHAVADGSWFSTGS